MREKEKKVKLLEHSGKSLAGNQHVEGAFVVDGDEDNLFLVTVEACAEDEGTVSNLIEIN